MKDNNTFTIIPYKNHFIKFSNLLNGKIIYPHHYLDLVTGKIIKRNWKEWFNEYNFSINTYFNRPKITHLFYELGFFIENLDEVKLCNETILAIDLEFSYFEKVKLQKPLKKIELKEILSPTFEEYNVLFEKGFKELTEGNCYQFNLTQKFNFRFNELSPIDFINQVWKNSSSCGTYGSATYIPCLDKLYFSNSPECLFQLNDQLLTSMPIKGTILCESDNEIESKWNELSSDLKCESELFMIADLIRNDLSRIEYPCAEILKYKAILRVPKLLHQYSELGVKLSENVKIKNIIGRMFPGGSVTGAPKKRVLKILREIENRDRGFYCGSTLIFFNEMKSASINIRSAEIDFSNNNLTYQAGGGITLRSISDNEYLEMLHKVKSFTSLLTL